MKHTSQGSAVNPCGKHRIPLLSWNREKDRAASLTYNPAQDPSPDLCTVSFVATPYSRTCTNQYLRSPQARQAAGKAHRRDPKRHTRSPVRTPTDTADVRCSPPCATVPGNSRLKAIATSAL